MVSVQPMGFPSFELFYLDYTYEEGPWSVVILDDDGTDDG